MKLISYLMGFTASLLLSSTAVQATTPGLYLGLQLGWGRVNQGEFISSHIKDAMTKIFPESYANLGYSRIAYTDTGRGGRFYLGYQFNNFLAAELGYTRFSSLNFNANAQANINVFAGMNVDVSTYARVTTDAFDLDVKGILPIKDFLNIYLRLGLAALNSSGTASVTFHTDYTDFTFATSPSVNLVYPVIGVGVGYDITRQASIEIAYTRIQKVNPCQYPSIDFVSIGMIYRV